VLNPSASSPFTALLVEPDDVWRVLTKTALTAGGLYVTAVGTYDEAVPLLATAPLLLMTEIRLGAYNGLHLAMRGRTIRPDIKLVVTGEFRDAVLQREADFIGATLVSKPVTANELLAAVYRTAVRRPDPDGLVDPVRPPFERRARDRRERPEAPLPHERRRSDRRGDIETLLVRITSSP
jgi:CheY-like chemotaxis protein